MKEIHFSLTSGIFKNGKHNQNNVIYANIKGNLFLKKRSKKES